MISIHVFCSQIGTQACEYHRISINRQLVSLTPNKHFTPKLRHLTATNFTFVRHSSNETLRELEEPISNITGNEESLDLTTDIIPDAPEIPSEVVEEVVKVFVCYLININKAILIIIEFMFNQNKLGEETLQSAGLGSWSPVGMLQNALEFMHVSCGLPWWGAIIAGNYIPSKNIINVYTLI